MNIADISEETLLELVKSGDIAVIAGPDGKPSYYLTEKGKAAAAALIQEMSAKNGSDR